MGRAVDGRRGGRTPWLLRERLHVLDLDADDIAGLGAGDLEGTGEVVDAGEVAVEDVVGGVVVLDLAAGPVNAFNLDGLAGFDLSGEGNCRKRSS